MPVFHYICFKCNTPPIRKLLSVTQSKEDQLCLICKEKMKRQPTAPTVQVKEKLDNGAMTKAIERYAEAERLFKERSGK